MEVVEFSHPFGYVFDPKDFELLGEERDEDLYIFTQFKKKTLKGSRINRSAGTGTWQGEDGGTEFTIRKLGLKRDSDMRTKTPISMVAGSCTTLPARTTTITTTTMVQLPLLLEDETELYNDDYALAIRQYLYEDQQNYSQN
ncbi:hypothetical protein Pint_30925 [Pistacia integerrima]|uniref:Uncharacterized protein n=1 Tax=Pistacia integerrima TaxID=434235 RepID=A0ACC0XN24_9ROSI|nr:hypothetical protein Pint_30925 [Pistacia integerrima]